MIKSTFRSQFIKYGFPKFQHFSVQTATSHQVAPEKLEELRARAEKQIHSFSHLQTDLSDFDLNIVFHDGWRGDVVKGIFPFRLRLLRYEVSIPIAKSSSGKEIVQSCINLEKSTINIDWIIRFTPGWSIVFIWGFFGLWKKDTLKKAVKGQENELLESHGFSSILHVNKKGRIDEFILKYHGLLDKGLKIQKNSDAN